MASKNLCVCHDNEFNKGIVGKNGFYFKSDDDVSELFRKIEITDISKKKDGVFKLVEEYYNWEVIGKRYIAYFNKIRK